MNDNVIAFPNAINPYESVWDFPTGDKLTLQTTQGNPLTVERAIYMLEKAKFDLLYLMEKE